MRRFLIILKKFFVSFLATVKVITMTLLNTEKQGLNFQEYEYIRNNDIMWLFVKPMKTDTMYI